MSENSKYYTPNLSEFHEDFEYEMKASFGDGTVKTKEQFNAAEWHKERIIFTSAYPYIERTLHGKNSQNGLHGIRVKYLDREDIESEGWKMREYKGVNCYQKSMYLLYFFGTNKTAFNPCILSIDTIIEKDNITTAIFRGVIKNISELRKLQKQLGIK